jgi:hypothetical protein
MQEEANDKFFDEYFKGRPKATQIFSRYDNGYYADAEHRQDSRRGGDITAEEGIAEYYNDYWEEYLEHWEDNRRRYEELAEYFRDLELDENGDYSTEWGKGNGTDLTWWEEYKLHSSVANSY